MTKKNKNKSNYFNKFSIWYKQTDDKYSFEAYKYFTSFPTENNKFLTTDQIKENISHNLSIHQDKYFKRLTKKEKLEFEVFLYYRAMKLIELEGYTVKGGKDLIYHVMLDERLNIFIDENNKKLKTKKVFSSKTTPGYTSSVFQNASDVDIPGNAFYAWLFLLLTLDLGVALPAMFMIFEYGGGLLIFHLFGFSIWIALLFRAYSKKQ